MERKAYNKFREVDHGYRVLSMWRNLPRYELLVAVAEYIIVILFQARAFEISAMHDAMKNARHVANAP